ncbi:MAG TPA: hypothetical protein VLO13_11010, partial [Halomonas sp.]|nr:hypothetical protein [Halomonas sp.]
DLGTGLRTTGGGAFGDDVLSNTTENWGGLMIDKNNATGTDKTMGIFFSQNNGYQTNDYLWSMIVDPFKTGSTDFCLYDEFNDASDGTGCRITVQGNGNIQMDNDTLRVHADNNRVSVGTTSANGKLSVDTDPGDNIPALVVYQEDTTNNNNGLEIYNYGTGTSLLVGDSSINTDQTIRVVGRANAVLSLEADAGDTNESANPYITLSQDGGTNVGIIGLTGNAGISPTGATVTESLTNSLYLQAPEGDDIQFATKQAGQNAAVQVTISPDGHVGIGDDNPSEARLVVEGKTSDSTAFAFAAQDASGDEIFYIRNDGNVGVGDEWDDATNPAVMSSLLTVEDSRYLEYITTLRNRNAGGEGLLIETASGGNSDYALRVTTRTSTTALEAFSVRNDGHVGIGTVTPGAQLHINTNGDNNGSGLIVEGYDNESVTQAIEVIDENGNVDFLLESVGDGGTSGATAYFRGNVGIGTVASTDGNSILDLLHNGARLRYGSGTGLQVLTTGTNAWTNLGTNSGTTPI